MVMQLRYFAFAAGLAMLAGCGAPGIGVPLYPVKGTITYEDGTPLPKGGSLAFIPADPKAKYGATGEIEEGGKFEVMSLLQGVEGAEAEAGAPAGTYKVTLSYPTTPPMTDSEEPPTDDGAADGGSEPEWTPVQVNSKYESPDTTDLEVVIKEGGDENLVLKITK